MVLLYDIIVLYIKKHWLKFEEWVKVYPALFNILLVFSRTIMFLLFNVGERMKSWKLYILINGRVKVIECPNIDVNITIRLDGLLRVYHLYMLIVLLFVLFMIMVGSIKGRFKILLSDRLEYGFLLIPVLIVGILVYTSLRPLYNIRWVILGNIVLIIGYQWYWATGSSEMYLSNILRYVIERNEVTFSINTNEIRITGSANDVIHSMYLPISQFKIDLIPGRLSTASLNTINLINYGVCAEICGANHAFIPFKFIVVS